MKKSEKRAAEELRKYDVHTDKRGSSASFNRDAEAWEPHQAKSTRLRNVTDAIKTFRSGR